jgi:hypothetical protein
MRLLHREPETDRTVEETADDRTATREGERTGVFGRRARRTDEPAAATTTDPAVDDDRTVARRRGMFNRTRDEDVVTERRVYRERPHRGYHIGNVLTIAGGAALAIIGIVALIRTGVNSTWDQPVTHVLRIDYSPLVAAIQVGAGVLLVLLGLSGRIAALFGCVALAVASVVAAIQPGRLETQYALETWWAWAVFAGAAFVALVLLLPFGRRQVVHTEPV